MLWIELLVALCAGGVGVCFSLVIAGVGCHIDKRQRERPSKKKPLPYLESAPIAADDMHLAEVASMRRERKVRT